MYEEPEAQVSPHLHLLGTHSPPAFGLDHSATERLGDELVAEADPDEGNLLLRHLANELFQVADPRLVVVDRVPRPGRDPGVALPRICGHIAPDDVVDDDLHLGMASEQPPKHVRIVAGDMLNSGRT